MSSHTVNLDRRKLLLSVMFGATASVTLARKPHQRIDYLGAGKLEKLVPARVGDWEFLTTSGLVVPPEDPLSDALYSDLLTRVYTDGASSPVMLLVAQSSGQTGLLQVHRPEYCYPAGGYQLSPITQRRIQMSGRALEVNQLTATSPERTEHILYWTRVGDSMPVSWAEQRLTIAIDNLKGRIPDAVLVRVSTIDADGASAFNRLADFIEKLLAAMPGETHRVLVSGVDS